MRILVLSTPLGPLGSGKGGGVELTAMALTAGLLARGHRLTVLAPNGSRLPPTCAAATLIGVSGTPPPSWQHQPYEAPVTMPADGLLGHLWRRGLRDQEQFDVLLNLAYDWLPLWLTPHTLTPLAHLISMGSVSAAIDALIAEISHDQPCSLAFHTASQARDFSLAGTPVLVGNGFDLARYHPVLQPPAPPLLGWAGRVAPEKGLEDAAAVAADLGLPLAVWGVREDGPYADRVEASVPSGTLRWRGFLPTDQLQAELGACTVLLNTPKWNEAFGNVVVEAMACGVPVAAYARGGPGELVVEGINGALARPDDRAALSAAVQRARGIERAACRRWAEQHCSQDAFAARVESWLERVAGGR